MKIDETKAAAAFPAFLKQFEITDPAPVPTPDPIPTPVPDPTPMPSGKKMADFVSVLYNSDNIVQDAAGNVTKLKAVKGGVDLAYNGIATPTLSKPFVVNNNEVVFQNQPKATFGKQTRDNSNPFSLPEEFTFILRRLPGTDYETILNNWGMPYFGFKSLTELRALNPGVTFPNDAPINYYELMSLHYKMEPAAGGNATCHAWVNGAYQGSVTSTGSDWYKRLGYAVGTETNSADYNWFATAFIERGMTDAERADYFAAIRSEYAIGSIPDLPYASEIQMVSTGKNLYANYKYNGSAAEDKSKVQYQWYKQSPDLSNQVLIGTGASIPNQKSVKCCVKVTDGKGRSWMFMSGEYNA